MPSFAASGHCVGLPRAHGTAWPGCIEPVLTGDDLSWKRRLLPRRQGMAGYRMHFSGMDS